MPYCDGRHEKPSFLHPRPAGIDAWITGLPAKYISQARRRGNHLHFASASCGFAAAFVARRRVLLRPVPLRKLNGKAMLEFPLSSTKSHSENRILVPASEVRDTWWRSLTRTSEAKGH